DVVVPRVVAGAGDLVLDAVVVQGEAGGVAPVVAGGADVVDVVVQEVEPGGVTGADVLVQAAPVVDDVDRVGGDDGSAHFLDVVVQVIPVVAEVPADVLVQVAVG